MLRPDTWYLVFLCVLCVLCVQELQQQKIFKVTPHKTVDTEAHSTRKEKNYYFVCKAHIGADKDTRIVHTVKVTAADVRDVTMTAQLLTGEEGTVY